jgi:hypothetical protein
MFKNNVIRRLLWISTPRKWPGMQHTVERDSIRVSEAPWLC